MNIYEIKRRTAETCPYFFSRKTMKASGQTLKDFHVYKRADGKYHLWAKYSDNWGYTHKTERIFNPETNKLERV